EEVSLPLGIDRAIHPQRNVTQVQTEKGVFSKDEVTRYAVKIEVANPYPGAVPLKIVEEYPLAGNKDMEVTLVDAHGAEVDVLEGKLTWHLSAPARGKAELTYVYELKR